MTKYNSSFYRVTPLMNYLGNNVENLKKFLKLVNININTPPLNTYYGDCEKLIKPTKEFLKKSLIYFGTHDCSRLEQKRSRIVFFNGNSDKKKFLLAEGLKEIENNYDALSPASKDWYIFEGFTHPDIFIEGDDYVIVCEAKWTEKGITTHTTNLDPNKNGGYRSQMIRHIQATLNYTNKKVYAFYIVDAECSYLNDLTKEALIGQLEKETIQSEQNEKVKILQSFCGHTTWQDIENIFPDLKFLTKTEIDSLKKLNMPK